VIGQLRVQKLTRRDGLRSWTIVWPEGRVHGEADRFLRRHDGSGTQRTYAYLLVDHLRWLDRECLGVEAVNLTESFVHSLHVGVGENDLGSRFR